MECCGQRPVDPEAGFRADGSRSFALAHCGYGSRQQFDRRAAYLQRLPSADQALKGSQDRPLLDPQRGGSLAAHFRRRAADRQAHPSIA